MSDLTPKQQQLMNAWGAIHKGAGEALEWIEQVRGNAASVEAEADGLSLRLRRARNRAKSLQYAASTPMGVGFFGGSQAGKSYLISSLAAATDGKLLSDFGPHTLDFIRHVNPPGLGKEATGVITRFSRRAKPSPDPNYPVELKLFCEVELAMMLSNSWFEDFDQERLNNEITDKTIEAVLREFEGQTVDNRHPGVDGDDVVRLWDYLAKNYEKSVRCLEGTYWPRAIELAPHLSIPQRARLFSILWGGQKPLTDLYILLAGALQKLGFPEKVFAPLGVLAEEKDGDYVRTVNLMSVDMLKRLDTRLDQPVSVLPECAGTLRGAVGVTIAQLTALTVEMTFRLVHQPSNAVLEQVDLIDFPGYRTRYQLLDINELAGVEPADEVNPIWSMLLRGKVAYLFERYSEAQEMHGLVLCTNANKQVDVVTIAPVLTRWIHNTQGATPAARKNRAPGLIWALTMMDMWIDSTLSQDDGGLATVCENMFFQAMLERFGNLEWMKEWSGTPFNNTYLVRKPRLESSFLVRNDSSEELELAPRHADHMRRLQGKFELCPTAIRHLSEPKAAWEAMLAFNDGGITRFCASLKAFENVDFKLSRIEEQLQECRTDLLEHGLYTWREEDFESLLERKREKVKYLLRTLGADPDVISELIHTLQLPTEQLRELYLGGVYDIDGDDEAPGEAESAFKAPANKAPAIDFGNLFDNTPTPSAASAAKPVAKRLTSEQRFARAALKAWIKHMRDLGTQPQRLLSLRMSRELMDALTEELVSAVRRPALLEQLDEAVTRRILGGARRDQLVQRQVIAVQLVMRDFLSWFGLLTKPVDQRPPRLAGNKGPLFDFYQKVAVGELPILPEKPSHQEQHFQVDWLSGLAWLTQENAKSGADPEITTEQRRQLAVLLNTFEAS